MGTISSVYAVPIVRNDSQNEIEETKNFQEKVMDHSENSKDSENSTRNLAQENLELTQINKQLTETVERLKRELEKSNAVSEEIFGETTEQKIIRLEKLLQNERREKWEIIEKAETTRVELINREKELIEENNNLKRELENIKRQTKELGLVSERLKTDGSEEKDEETEKSTRLKEDLERFRADLSEKREARRKALSAVSTELNRLREELETEKEVRRKLERDLELHQKTDECSASDISIISAKKENETLKQEVTILTDDIEKLKELRTENNGLKSEVRQLSHEIRSLNTIILQLKNDYKAERRKLEKSNKEKEEMEKEKDRNVKMRKDLENEKEKMWEEYDKEKEEINKRTSALKEVIEISRQMLAIRESQVHELKTKLKEIEESVAHSKILEEEGLRFEYEKQLENIKTLKELYEERVRLMEMERDKLKETIAEHLKTIEDQKGEIDGLKERFGNTSEELEKEKLENQNLERNLRMSLAKSKDFENELALMNNMFTQMLLGPFNTGTDTDLDKLTEFLQENHQLITELTTKEESSEIASAFPKLLLDLLTQVDGTENLDVNSKNRSMLESTDTISEQSESILEENKGAVLPILSYKNATVFRNPTAERKEESEEIKTEEQQQIKPSETIDPAVQEIASNLPKVWKVLTELLSIHSTAEGPTPGDEKQCYKNIETPYGTKSVISVSNTFIRLKDLILEKKSLQKELGRLKQLNSHLETRLDDQEKRLSQVQSELHKTWGIVGKMRAQHQQLHNHEKILRYELQEKRIMLSELKQELEYCRDKWERARQKNAESETEWKKLRKEFAARKIKNHVDSNLNDSAESGFSDEPNESGEEAENFDADRSSTQSPVDKNLSSEEGTSKGAVPKVRDGTKPSDKSKSRAIRLKRLEDQCQLLVRQVDITTQKSNYLSNRLEELHEHHASSEEIHRPITLKSAATEEVPSIGLAQSNQTEEAAASLQLMENSRPVAYASVNNEESGTRLETLSEEASESRQENQKETKEERLKRLETESQALVSDVVNIVEKSECLSDKLDELHENRLKYEASSECDFDHSNSRQEKPNETTSETFEKESVAEGSLAVVENQNLSGQSNEVDERHKTKSNDFEADSETLAASKSEENSESKEAHLLRLELEASFLIEKSNSTPEKNGTSSKELEKIVEECLRPKQTEDPSEEEKKTVETHPKNIKTETREERLQRLENEGRSLLCNVINTVEKSESLSNKLDEMHARVLRRELSKEEKTDEAKSSNQKSEEDLEESAIALPVTDETKTEKEKLVELETQSSIENFTISSTKVEDVSDTTRESSGEGASNRGAIPRTETRAQRLKRLEEECQAFMKKATNTVQKSIDLSNKLDDIHDTYVNYEASKMTFPDENNSNDSENSGKEKVDEEKEIEKTDEN